VKPDRIDVKHIGLVPDFVMESGEKTGIDIFSTTFIPQLLNCGTEYRFTLFLTKKRQKEFSGLPSNVQVANIPEFMGRGFANIFWYMFCLPLQAWFCRVDLLHLFAGNRRVTMFPADRILVTVHDIFHYHRKDLYTLPRYLYFRGVVIPLLKRQKNFHTISLATKKELERYLRIPKSAAHVGYLGLAPFRISAQSADTERYNIRRQYHLERPYMLYVSSLDHPRKNHMVLLDAYELLLRKGDPVPDLVFAGTDFFQAEMIHSEISRRNLVNRVRTLGYVPDVYMPSLFREATLFLHPSALEGFGYPLIEAMTYGLPVACADTDVFREIGGGVPLYFDAGNPHDIVSCIERILGDSRLREDRAQKGIKQAEQFTIERCSAEIQAIYEHVLAKQSGGATR
jgi:glycosyltransferase involved in cell wall biosynthesis